jgi:hypothetical protein
MLYSWEIVLDRAVKRFARFIHPSENPSPEETLALGILSRLSDLSELTDAEKVLEVADFRDCLNLLMDEYKKDRSRDGAHFRDAIFSALIAIALASPRNLTDPCSMDEIEPEARIATADGFQFDIHYLARWIKTKGEWINPLTRAKFTSRDKAEIRAFTLSANVGVDLTHVAIPRDERVDLTNQEITRMLAQDSNRLSSLRMRIAELRRNIEADLQQQRSLQAVPHLPTAPNPVPAPPIAPRNLPLPQSTIPIYPFDARSRNFLPSGAPQPSMSHASSVVSVPPVQPLPQRYFPSYVPSALSLPTVPSTLTSQQANSSASQSSSSYFSTQSSSTSTAPSNLFSSSSDARSEQKHELPQLSNHSEQAQTERLLDIQRALAESNARLAIIRARRLLDTPIESIARQSSLPQTNGLPNRFSSIGALSPGYAAASLFAPPPVAREVRPSNSSESLTPSLQLAEMTMPPTGAHSSTPHISRRSGS